MSTMNILSANTSSTSGAFSIGGLITGLDTNSIISQLMQVEEQPITNLQSEITALQKQQSTMRDLRTQLLTLSNDANDFQITNTFNQFQSASSDTTVLGADVSSATPVSGSYEVNVTQLATATVATSSAAMGSPVNADAALNSSGMGTTVSAGTFTVNGVSFTVDPTMQTLNQVLTQITSSSAGVNATYDSATDKVTFANKNAGDTSLINFGASTDTSNFLSAISVNQAMQADNSSGSTQAISTLNLGSVNASAKLNAVNFAGGAVTAGTFFVNGVSISVDPTTDSLADVLQRINNADSQVSVSYDGSSDKIRAISKTLGSRTIAFAAGTSNFLTATNLAAATQTAGKDSQFTVNGGAVQTRNTNQVSDAVGGVTLHFLSTGTSTVTISNNDDAVVTSVNKFISDFNDSIDLLVADTAKAGGLANDSSIQGIQYALQNMIFGSVPGLSGPYGNLLDIGISTGSTFDVSSVSHLQLDETAFRAALQNNRSDVAAVFSNSSKTGTIDQLFSYLDGITNTSGFLNDRSKANGDIDQQISDINNQISNMQDQANQYQARLKQEFLQMEQMAANFKNQGNALAALGTTTVA